MSTNQESKFIFKKLLFCDVYFDAKYWNSVTKNELKFCTPFQKFWCKDAALKSDFKLGWQQIRLKIKIVGFTFNLNPFFFSYFSFLSFCMSVFISLPVCLFFFLSFFDWNKFQGRSWVNALLAAEPVNLSSL